MIVTLVFSVIILNTLIKLRGTPIKHHMEENIEFLLDLAIGRIASHVKKSRLSAECIVR